MPEREREAWFVQVMFDGRMYHVFHEQKCMFWVMEDVAGMIADEQPENIEIRATRKKL